MGDGISSMTLKIPAVHHQFPSPVELVGKTHRDHYSQTVGPAGMRVAGEVPVAAVVGWRDLWLFVVGPVKVVAAGFVGKVERSAENRRPVVPVVELYAGGGGSGQGRDCDCDWYGYGSCDSSDCGHRAAEVADGHKHDCSPDH